MGGFNWQLVAVLLCVAAAAIAAGARAWRLLSGSGPGSCGDCPAKQPRSDSPEGSNSGDGIVPEDRIQLLYRERDR